MTSNCCARAIVALLLVLAVLVRADRARADAKVPPAASLSFTRGQDAESCITARELARKVEERLGRAAFVSAAQADLFIEANVTRAGRGWRGSVSATRASGATIGSRAFKTAEIDCHALDDDLVLVIALVIDPSASTAPAARPSPAAKPAPPSPIYVEVPVPAPAPRWAYEARLAAVLLLDVLPSAAPALEASFAATPPGGWPIEIGAVASTLSRAAGSGQDADVRLVAGSLAVCPAVFVRTAFRAQLCAGAYVGGLLASALGVGGGDVTALVVDPFLRARGEARLAGPLFAVVDVGGMVALSRPQLTYTQLDTTSLQVVKPDLYRMPAVGFDSSIGLALHFP